MNRYLRDRVDRRYNSRGSDHRYRREPQYNSDYRYEDRNYRPYQEPRVYNDYRPYREEDYGDDEYKREIRKLIDRLKQRDRFNLPKTEVISKARKMNVNFDNYDEDEFYLVYLMQVTDYPSIAQDPHTYIAMARDWLEDDDVMRKGCEKLCAYVYEIVLGE